MERFDPARPLVIDPSVAWSTVIGSPQGNESLFGGGGGRQYRRPGRRGHDRLGHGVPDPAPVRRSLASDGVLPRAGRVGLLASLGPGVVSGASQPIAQLVTNVMRGASGSSGNGNGNGQTLNFSLNGYPMAVSPTLTTSLGDFINDICTLVEFGSPQNFAPQHRYASGDTMISNGFIWIAMATPPAPSAGQADDATVDPRTGPARQQERQPVRLSTFRRRPGRVVRHPADDWAPVTVSGAATIQTYASSNVGYNPGDVVLDNNNNLYVLLGPLGTNNNGNNNGNGNSNVPTPPWFQLQAPVRFGAISNATLVGALQSAETALHGGALAFMGIPDETMSLQDALAQVDTAIGQGLLVPFGIYNDGTTLGEFLSRLAKPR